MPKIWILRKGTVLVYFFLSRNIGICFCSWFS